MNAEVLDFVASQRVSVLTVELLDGSLHGSAVHFAHRAEPLTFIFLTDSKYRKFQPLLKKDNTRASLVIGASEDVMKTVQITGAVQILKEDELILRSQELKDIYFKKFPEKKEKFKGPDDVFIIFTPMWWRYTDWTVPGDKKMFTSVPVEAQ